MFGYVICYVLCVMCYVLCVVCYWHVMLCYDVILIIVGMYCRYSAISPLGASFFWERLGT